MGGVSIASIERFVKVLKPVRFSLGLMSISTVIIWLFSVRMKRP